MFPNTNLLTNKDWLPYWYPDDMTTHCSNALCSSQFGLINRKHHCRKCGKIFCSNCWGRELFLPIYNKKVPVCDQCYK